ncbi:MAG: OFA family MFS transporter [Candidatus Thorarchaeota archaeon]|nr:OFA family MFS transporter [Candidatus Thorarchaeota archaeon]
MSESVTNRNIVIVGAIIVQLCLGSIYSWTIFQKFLVDVAGAYAWSTLNSNLPFAAGLASFALFMIPAGRMQDRVGPRKVATLGGILLGIGYILASQVDLLAPSEATGTLYLVVTYGVIGGAGIGFGYVCPIAALVRWFPDKKGAITGIAVAGFGGGAFIFNFVEQWLLAIFGVVGTPFFYLGMIYLVGVLIGAQMLSSPPKGWLPAGYVPKVAVADGVGQSLMPGQMIRTSSFLVLWLMFALAATAGLMTIGNVSKAAQVADPYGMGPGSWDAYLSALVGGIMALFNAAGRIIWGVISDKKGRVTTFMLMFFVLSMAMFSFAYVVLINSSWIVSTLVAGLVGFCFGGNFALFPSATAEYFGSEHVGKNYGVVFTSYGVAGVLGALVAGQFVALAGGSYFLAFTITGILGLVAFALTFLLREMRRPVAQ